MPKSYASTIPVRPASQKALDAAAVRAIAQAAVSVELFTIPLYMTALYSIQGTHEINSAGATWYKGRCWPGMDTSISFTTNSFYFNLTFSVFIDEMLHLEMAANIANAIGQAPNFQDPALQNSNGTWVCYGPAKSVIPHIIDLKDTISLQNVAVNLGPLNDSQLQLFKAIEEDDQTARQNIQASKIGNYFPTVPFATWTETNQVLPMFGTISCMYDCLATYLELQYDDGTTLWDYVYTPGSLQRDLFNYQTDASGGHPQSEYPKFNTALPATVTSAQALSMVQDMMTAITDQGEGSTSIPRQELITKTRALMADQVQRAKMKSLIQDPNPFVNDTYQPDPAALDADYPSYDENGDQEAESRDSFARVMSGGLTHYERFSLMSPTLPDLVTWDLWYAKGNTWTPEMLVTSSYDPNTPSTLPTPQAVADALNALRADSATYQPMLNSAVIGSILGMTSVLTSYWADPSVSFPSPAMSGTSNRMIMFWSVYGTAPDLTIPIPAGPATGLWNACQGISIPAASGTNACGVLADYHSCIGSNTCAARGGCGFVQSVNGGGGCGGSAKAKVGGANNLCGGPTPPTTMYTAPGNNKCQSFGGCAVPISASQVYTKSGTMQLYTFDAQGNSTPLSTMPFTAGDLVHDVAYKAFTTVMAAEGKTVPATPPAPNLIRTAFPPST